MATSLFASSVEAGMKSYSTGSEAVGCTMAGGSLRPSASGDRLSPTPSGADGATPPSEGPMEQVMVNGDGIDPPLMVLFPPENLNLQWTEVRRVGAGLQNMGNTCFMNSCLQCLTYTPPFANYMTTREHSSTCGESGFCMMCVMEDHVFQALDNSGNIIMPLNVHYQLTNIGSQFRFGQQEDAHEFLWCSLEAMQQSCLSGIQFDMSTQTTTFIHQVFGGYLRSRVTCLNCRAVSDTFEPFLDIPLDIEKAPSVSSALEQFVTPEALGGCNAYRCSKCHQMVTAMKGFSIHRSANILTLTLKRFRDFVGGKISKVVMYPERLDLRPFMSRSQGEPQEYQLYAVLVHSGRSCRAGHYFSYVKAASGQWFRMDDSSVTAADISLVLTEQAYMLFYIKSDEVKHSDAASNTSGGSPPAPVMTSDVPVPQASVDSMGPQLQPPMTEVLHTQTCGSNHGCSVATDAGLAAGHNQPGDGSQEQREDDRHHHGRDDHHHRRHHHRHHHHGKDRHLSHRDPSPHRDTHSRDGEVEWKEERPVC